MKSARHVILATLTAISVGAAAPRRTAEEVYELPTTGKNLERRAGGWVNFSTPGPRAVVRFFDEKKKPTPPDVRRGLAIYRYPMKAGFERTTFLVEGDALKSPGNVHPPYRFRMILTLLADADGAADAPEVFTFSYP